MRREGVPYLKTKDFNGEHSKILFDSFYLELDQVWTSQQLPGAQIHNGHESVTGINGIWLQLITFL
jgi:hypothetical protein